MRNAGFFCPLLIICLSTFSCGDKDKDSKKGSSFGAPAVEPPVAKATPAGLSDLSLTSQDVADFPSAIKKMFTDTFPKTSGGDAKGLIKSALEDLDTRMEEIDKRGLESPKKCYENTAKPLSLKSDLGLAKIDLNLQCLDRFTQSPGEQSAQGSGMAFGADGEKYSLWLQLVLQDETKHGYFANINKETEEVEFLYINDSRSTNDRATVYKVTTAPSQDAYEVSFVSTSNDYQTCNFHIKSDGKVIHAQGTNGGSNDCATLEAASVCLDAKTYGEDGAECEDVASVAFVLPSPNANELDESADSVAAMLNLDLAESVTSDFKEDGQE